LKYFNMETEMIKKAIEFATAKHCKPEPQRYGHAPYTKHCKMLLM